MVTTIAVLSEIITSAISTTLKTLRALRIFNKLTHQSIII